jgi:2-amino-4-hydroxy-6-hydroxymethyldihydropteridine diphosphokinase
MSSTDRLVLVALGSNAASAQGDARTTVEAAVASLRAAFGADLVSSRFYATPAFPAGAGPDFVNAACAFRSDLSAEDILARLHAIEQDFGRERRVRWGQRSLDLDLIAVADLVLPDAATQVRWRDLPLEQQKVTAPDQLILPHPRLQDRSFVLVPLADVACDWRHPGLDLTVSQMLAARPYSEKAEVKPL